jgi:hypothetical protein
MAQEVVKAGQQPWQLLLLLTMLLLLLALACMLLLLLLLLKQGLQVLVELCCACICCLGEPQCGGWTIHYWVQRVAMRLEEVKGVCCKV